jgi:hypothetical protein
MADLSVEDITDTKVSKLFLEIVDYREVNSSYFGLTRLLQMSPIWLTLLTAKLIVKAGIKRMAMMHRVPSRY